MNPHLDPGLVACTLLAVLFLAGTGLWLYGAGHLDQIERSEPAPERTTAASPVRPSGPGDAASSQVLDAAREWGAKGSMFSTGVHRASGPAGPDRGRPSPRRDSDQ